MLNISQSAKYDEPHEAVSQIQLSLYLPYATCTSTDFCLPCPHLEVNIFLKTYLCKIAVTVLEIH